MGVKPQEQHGAATVRQVGRAYRAGVLSLRAIAAKYEVGTATIRRWAEKYGWKRDLKKDVRIEAERRSMTPKKKAKAEAGAGVMELSDEEIIDAFADQGAEVLRTHRKQIQALREYGMRLVGDLGKNRQKLTAVLDAMAATEATPPQPPKKSRRKKAQAADLETEAKKKGESYLLVTAYREAVGVQAAIYRDLTMAMSKVIPLERDAFGLNTKGEEDSESFDERVRALAENEPEQPEQDTLH